MCSKSNLSVFPIVMITGLSGSGKSTALDVFEDMGFFKIDGLPSAFTTIIVRTIQNSGFSDGKGLVLCIDLRTEKDVDQFEKSLIDLKESGFTPYILFLEANSNILINRYASTRRPHPLEKEGIGLEQSLIVEKKRLDKIRMSAGLILDTSSYSVHDLRRTLQKKWSVLYQNSLKNLRIHLISFGFKYGTPADADMTFDLRFLPNPFFDPKLKALSGLDNAVAKFVLKSDQGILFFEHLADFLQFIIDQNEKEGRYRLTIGIGCTGGRHRSVAVAESLAKLFSDTYLVSLEHRHLELG